MSFISYNAFVDKFKSKTSVWLQWRKNMILMLLHKIHSDNHRGSSYQSSLAVRFLKNYSEKGLRVCSLIAFKKLQNVKSEQMKKAKMTSGADFIMTLGLASGRLRLIPTQPSSLITFTFDHWLEPRRNISEFERSASKLNVNLNDFQLWPSWGRDDWDDVRCDVRNASSGDSGSTHDQQRASSSTISTTASTSSLKIKNQ